MPTGTITFRNFTQKVLWDNEIAGQLSDGHWENQNISSRIWMADSKVGTPGVNFNSYGRANFNFASPELLNVVGERMLLYAKASKVTKKEDIIAAAEYLEGIKDETEFNKILQNTKDYRSKYLSVIKTWKNASKIINASYTEAQLKADLKDMSRTVSMSGYHSTAPKKSIPDRDLQRVQGILSRAGGNTSKLLSLTRTMADATTDRVKLQARGDAMKELGYNHLAKIFYNKLKECKVNDLLKTFLKETIMSDEEFNKQRIINITKVMKKVGLTSVNKIRESEEQKNVFICDYIVHGELTGRTFIDLGNLLNCMVSFRPTSKNSLEITFAWHSNRLK